VPPPLRDNLSPQKHFRRPRLGVSVIGSGHGFDPGNRTSGFLMWIDGRGVLVDPPVDALDWLASYDLSGRDIDSLILTHCHADHDAGALQKILHEERITIYTTATVMSSFVAKYARLTGLEPGAFRRLFDFVPVRHGEPITMHGAEVTFRYSLHTVPCVGLEVLFGGKGLVYPSDTLNDVQTFLRLRDEGIMSQNRARELAAFPWHHELILHEAGVPPIHTPVNALAQLDEAVKKRLYLVHVSARSLPPDAGLHVAPTGLESTIDLHATGSDGTHVLEALDVMARVDILRRLPASRAAEFVRYVQRVSFREGQRILTRGEAGDALYFIVNGTVAVVLENHEERTYGAYDYLGETALVEEAPRSADAYAKTDVSALRVSAADFRRLLRGTRIATRLRHLARMRELPSWQVLQSSSALSDLTSNQKTQLQALMTTATFEAGAPLSDAALLVASGEVEVVRDEQVVALLRRGDLAFDVKAYGTLPEGALSFRCRTPVSGFLLSDEGFAEFLHRNPGAAMRLAHALGERLQAGC
ncbi:MAG: MBL fold metallo-hydrolase, partial [Proteobacteria bacterium]|nr:MBL fold metallo-hydrolase [Pseudomonadota bacterium]